MPDRIPNLSDDASPSELITVLTQAVTVAKELATNVSELTRQVGRNRLMLRLLAGSLFFDILLTVILGGTIYAVDTNSSHIGDIQSRVSNQVLCPLYILLDQTLQHPRQKGESAAEYRIQLHDKAILLAATKALGCPPVLQSEISP